MSLVGIFIYTSRESFLSGQHIWNLLTCLSFISGENMDFDDSFDEIDESLLRNLPLDFPFDDEVLEAGADTDSGIGSHDAGRLRILELDIQ